MDMGGRARFTRGQWCVMATLGSIKFVISLGIALQWPLFPGEAEKKGSTATEYGLVLGVFSLGSFISCPIYGHYMNRIGAKKLLNFGILLTGISVVGLGLLDLIESHVTFLAMAFFMKILESLGTAAAITSTYSITVVVFYDSIAMSFAVTEAFTGLGLMVGPVLAGYLFEVGGYMFPFVAVGGLLVILAAMVLLCFPDIDNLRNLDITHVRVSSLLVLMPVVLDLFGRTLSAIVSGFIITLLEPHLRQFHLDPVTTGLVFMIATGTYTCLSPLVGYLCGTMFYSKKVIIAGGLFLVVGTSLIGPAPFLGMETTLWGVCVGLMVNGIGQSCILVPTFIDAIHSAVAVGLPNDVALYGVVAGLSHSSFALGDTLGPAIGGTLMDSVGFSNGTIFLLVMQAIMVVAMTSYVCSERRGKRLLYVETALNYESITSPID